MCDINSMSMGNTMIPNRQLSMKKENNKIRILLARNLGANKTGNQYVSFKQG